MNISLIPLRIIQFGRGANGKFQFKFVNPFKREKPKEEKEEKEEEEEDKNIYE